LLQREGWTVNSKRVYRIYVEEKLDGAPTQAETADRAQARVRWLHQWWCQ
jgi:hypothetical protein